MAGHIPILGPGGDSSVPAGTAAIEPGAISATNAYRAAGPSHHAWKEPNVATPTVTVALDAAVYASGDAMTLTVTYGDADTRPVTVTVVVTDAQGNSSAPARVTAVIRPLIRTVTDDSDRTWTKLSDNGVVADYRAVA